MSVLKQILEWSNERPAWQRDALRRLVLNGELSDEDIGALTEICKSAYGLAEPQEAIPLSAEHIPETAGGSGQVKLLSIFHHRGVNALAEAQTLKFSPSLTVVYGDNAAGKTGYIRILKSACRARGQEKILGNVVAGTIPQTPVVAIRYKVSTESESREWAGEGEDDFIARVSVFDSQCAAVYLTEKTDVAFRPFGLDLFDHLVQACRAVRARLETEQRTLTSGANPLFEAPEGTAVARLLASLSSLTKPEAVNTLATLSDDDARRLSFLEKSLLDLQANDPEKLGLQLTLRTGRVRTLARHLKDVSTALSHDTVKAALEARSAAKRKSEEAQRLRSATLPEGLLVGTGSQQWTQMWEAARSFSDTTAYPSQTFPVTEKEARCVLCQQDLNHAAGHRLNQFETFVVSTTERELRDARIRVAKLAKAFSDLKVTNAALDETIKEIRLEQDEVAEWIAVSNAWYEEYRQAIIRTMESEQDTNQSIVEIATPWSAVESLADQLEQRGKVLRESANEQQKKAMTAEVQELSARRTLAKNAAKVFAEIERKKTIAAYGLCLDETRSQGITQKSTAVTKATVSQKLKASFKTELKRLGFRHAEVELTEVGGADGVLYHKLVLTRAPGVELPKVVSEGEQRCLSIAAFFAELSTADDPSGIVFDDPVSSLDYKYREGVARRLAEEAKIRQVIVFTHDIVFLLLIKQFAEEHHIEQLDQHVRQLSIGAGVCIEEMPWVALAVKKKIGFLKNEWQTIEKLFRGGHHAAYEKEAKYLYGLLREAWERALEEVLLGGVIERFRSGVKTQHVISIADITAQDCSALDAAMTKCSKWLPGHDQAAAARADVPQPAELKSDIEALESWIAAIRKRRS